MLCVLKRVLPFTLTLAIGSLTGGFFNLFSSDTQPSYSPAPPPAVQSSYGRGGGCSARRKYVSTVSTARTAEVYSQPKPLYTQAALRNKTEGEVVLRITLGADGTVRDVETITSLPDGLTEQARRAAREIQFKPATRDGSPVDEVKTITYSFSLD